MLGEEAGELDTLLLLKHGVTGCFHLSWRERKLKILSFS